MSNKKSPPKKEAKIEIIDSKKAKSVPTTDKAELAGSIADGVNSVLQLAEMVISARQKRKDLETKGKIFLKALKEHEKTVRIAIENHTIQVTKVIDATSIIIEKSESAEERKLALKYLTEYSSTAIKELGKISTTALNQLPGAERPKLEE